MYIQHGPIPRLHITLRTRLRVDVHVAIWLTDENDKGMILSADSIISLLIGFGLWSRRKKEKTEEDSESITQFTSSDCDSESVK